MSDARHTVVIVTPYYPPSGGGLERYAAAIARNLHDSMGWRVIIITTSERGGSDEYSSCDGIAIYRLGYACKISNTPFSFAWYGKIRSILSAEKPDIINIHMPVPGIGDIAYLLAGSTPLFVTYHSGSMRKRRLAPDLLIALYENTWLPFLLRRADRIVTSSDWIRLNFLKRYQYKSCTVTPAVDQAVFSPAAGDKPPGMHVLFVAGLSRAERYKGLSTLLAAISIVRAALPGISLSVAGDGDMRTEYEAMAKSYGIESRVRFLGRLESGALAAEYRAAHLFAFPTEKDSFPLAILEAMSSGLPVISTAIGDIPKIVAHGRNGCLVPPGDPQSLADAMQQLFLQPERLRSFSRNAADRIRNNFEWRSRAARYDVLYRRSLPSAHGSPRSLVVVAPYFFPKIGGLENYAYEIARRLVRDGGYRVTVITSNHRSRGYSKETIDGVVIHRLPIWRRLSNTPLHPSWYWWMRRIFAIEKPDLIQVHSPVPFMADMGILAAGPTPVVMTYHSGSMRKGRYPVDLFIGIYERFVLPILFRRADAIAAISPDFAKKQLQRFRSKVTIIPPGVDLARFFPSESAGRSPLVMYVGRLERTSRWKGVDQLLDAMATVRLTHPEARLELVGSGDAIPMLRSRARRLGITGAVTFAGARKAHGLVEAYRRASVVVLASQTEAESFGMVLLEAMACGTPVIGTEVGGIPYLIDSDVNGIVVRSNDPPALVRAIGRILADPDLALRYRQRGISTAKKFDWNIQLERYRDLFARIKRASI